MQRVQGPVAPLFDICPKLGGLGKQIFDLKSVHLTKILLVISSLYYIVSQALGPGPRIPPGACQPIFMFVGACKSAYFATSFEFIG